MDNTTEQSPALITTTGPSENKMGMMQWLSTEGGRKCPQCGRYAKPSELGFVGFDIIEPSAWSIRTREVTHWSRVVIADIFGHLPGFGCNKERDNG